jgi:hypothetical protein
LGFAAISGGSGLGRRKESGTLRVTPRCRWLALPVASLSVTEVLFLDDSRS